MPLLRIENYKCFKKAAIPFGNLTVLVGVNGAGKSSTIQSLLLLREALFSPKEQRLPLNNFRGQNLGRSLDIVYDNDISRRIKISWHSKELESTSRVSLMVSDTDSMLDMDIINKSIGKTELSNLEFHFLSADRFGSTISQPIKAEDYPNVGERGQFCAQLLADKFGCKVAKERLYAADTSPYLIDQVNLYLKDIFPDVEIDAQASLDIQAAQIKIRNSVSKSFTVSTNTGFGISYLIPIIVTGLIAGKGTLMIVENPEAHLHPAAQSQVGKFLAKIASTGTTIVVETHSDYLVNGIQYFSVSNKDFLKKVVINNFSILNGPTGNNGKICIDSIKLTDNGDYSDWPEGFMDQSRKDLYELYQARMRMQIQ